MNNQLYRPSTVEDDRFYDDPKLGIYLWTVQSRLEAIAQYLGLASVYCVCQFPGKVQNPQVMFIQLSAGDMDSRNDKMRYVVVEDKAAISRIFDMLRKPYTEEESERFKLEDEQAMERARNGLHPYK